MEPENMNMDEITEDRRKALAESLHSISLKELTALGEKVFPIHDHPWRETFFNFLAENPHASFYYGTTHDHVHVIYCQDKDKGLWFLPLGGMGPLQKRGLTILKELSAGA